MFLQVQQDAHTTGNDSYLWEGQQALERWEGERMNGKFCFLSICFFYIVGSLYMKNVFICHFYVYGYVAGE